MNTIDISSDEKIKEAYDVFSSCTSKEQVYKHYGISHNSNGCRYVNEIANVIGFDFSIYKKKNTKYCLECGKEITKKTGKKFCSCSCSVKYNNKRRQYSDQYRQKISQSLKLYHHKKKLNCTNNNRSIKTCKCCGQEVCEDREICKHSYKFFQNLEYFGFNISSYGTKDVYSEYNKVKALLEEEYYINKLNSKDLKEKYDYPKTFENITHILKNIGIKIRNTSEAQLNLIERNRYQAPKNSDNYQFNHGWHDTWDNKKIYYRSSYELNYAKKLDEEKIKYEVEYLRIPYYDTILKHYRFAIPDFFLPDTNEIIEIKSRVTFHKQNMIDKFKKYIECGYTPKLLYENKMYDIGDMQNLKEFEYTFKRNKD